MRHDCRPCLGRILVAARKLPDFQALLDSFWVTVCRPCPRHGRDASLFSSLSRSIFRHMKATRCAGYIIDVGTFSGILSNFWDTVRRPCPGRVLVTIGKQLDFQAFLGISRQFLGHSVQAMSRTHPYYDRDAGRFSGTRTKHVVLAMSEMQVVYGTRSASHIQDAVVMQPDFQAFLSNFIGTAFLGAVCKPYPGRILDATRTQPNFRQFLAVFGTRCAGHVRDAFTTGKQPIFQAFLGTVYRPCPGCILVATRTQPDFQAFLGNFWDTVVSGIWCTGHVQGRDQIFRHFYAVFGTQYAGHVQDAPWLQPCPGRVLVAVGKQPDFSAFLGSFWDTVCRPCPGCSSDAARFSGISRQFMGMMCRTCP
ncbi:Hypothetical predicted protein [Olea europaea subsp. europaea]|uniref:Uncharacterized protein n=1 Tax=Olea europaea subsp. europaea TaxID=158383 RepID=A0A8S0T6M3_OLEEU|nr:Hypothetical predicted protein [Olea europaea subsp. europaea]